MPNSQSAQHNEVYPLRSQRAKALLRNLFYRKTSKIIGNQGLMDAINQLEAIAWQKNDRRKVNIRLARSGDVIYIDLCNDQWEFVEITKNGWRIISDPPVLFTRVEGMLSLPHPAQGGSLELLRPFISASDKYFKLLIACLIGATNPEGPFPILAMEGPQGTGKSTVARIIRSILDPSKSPIRSAPRDDRDLLIAANNGWFLGYDNLSSIPDWLSDAFCRLSTGAGYSCRQLYSDTGETIIQAKRPIIINGIDAIINRHDLLDRTIRCILDPIPEESRRLEKTIWKEFEIVHPKLLGAVCDAMATALANEEQVELEGLPRMADFAFWVTAAESALPWQKGEFLEAYRDYQDNMMQEELDSDLVASTIMRFMSSRYEWEGSPTDLLNALESMINEATLQNPNWPKNARSLGRRLTRLQGFLEELGIKVTREKGTNRNITIRHLNKTRRLSCHEVDHKEILKLC